MSFMDEKDLITCTNCGDRYNGKHLQACPACQPQNTRQMPRNIENVSVPSASTSSANSQSLAALERLLNELVEEQQKTRWAIRWVGFGLAIILMTAFYVKGINVHVPLPEGNSYYP